MTLTDYYTLFTLALVTVSLLVVPPIVKLFQLTAEGEREVEAARQRIAARQIRPTSLPAVLDGVPDPQERT
jgi:hypothetical protein